MTLHRHYNIVLHLVILMYPIVDITFPRTLTIERSVNNKPRQMKEGKKRR